MFSTTEPADKTLLLLPECFDYESKVNSGSLWCILCPFKAFDVLVSDSIAFKS